MRFNTVYVMSWLSDIKELLLKLWFHRKINTIYSGRAKIKPLYIVYIEDHCEKVWRPDHDDLLKEKLIGKGISFSFMISHLNG